MMSTTGLAHRSGKNSWHGHLPREDGVLSSGPPGDLTRDRACVIVGAGLAGANCAVTLREEGWNGRIVIVGREHGIPFGRPPLSKTYLRGEEPISAWYVKAAEWYDDNSVELRTGETVQTLDASQRRVNLEGGNTLEYDKLLLSTAGRKRK